MKKQKKNEFPKEQFMAFERGEDYVIPFNSVEQALDYLEPSIDEIIEIGVYKLEKVVKVKEEAAYKIIE